MRNRLDRLSEKKEELQRYFSKWAIEQGIISENETLLLSISIRRDTITTKQNTLPENSPKPLNPPPADVGLVHFVRVLNPHKDFTETQSILKLLREMQIPAAKEFLQVLEVNGNNPTLVNRADLTGVNNAFRRTKMNIRVAKRNGAYQFWVTEPREYPYSS